MSLRFLRRSQISRGKRIAWHSATFRAALRAVAEINRSGEKETRRIHRGGSSFVFPWSIRDRRLFSSPRGEKEDASRGCEGYYRDRGDSRPTFEMTVLFSVHGGLCKSRAEPAGDPPAEHREAPPRGGEEGKEILEHVFATFRARYRENSR